jgi:hypothetical protein
MNEKLPFIWRKYYRNEAIPSEKVLLETAHEKARQYLSRTITVVATRSDVQRLVNTFWA